MYIELIWIDNFIIDALLLATAAWATGLHTRLWRIACSAVLGSLYACLVLAGSSWWDTVPMRILVSLCMTVLVFPPIPWSRFFCGAVAFWLFSFLYGGVILGCNYLLDGSTDLYVNDNLRPIVWGTVVFVLAVQIAMRKRRVRDAADVTEVILTQGKRTVTVWALVDSGNLVREPLTHEPMLICEYRAVERLWDEHVRPFSLLCQTGSGEGEIRCFAVDSLRFGTSKARYSHLVIGVTDHVLSTDGRYQALLPPSLL